MQKQLIIVGGGGAGMSAGIYAARYGLDAILISPELGGMIATTHLVENYPGFPSIPGPELAANLKKHVESTGLPILYQFVENVTQTRQAPYPLYTVTCANGESYEAPAVLIATGSDHKHLGAPGEEKYRGKGVSYCATCDGMFFRERTVAVIGGSDSAAKEAIYLADICAKVYIIYRKPELSAEPINANRVLKHPKIETVPSANVVEFAGTETALTTLKLDTGREVAVDGAFVAIGYVPKTDMLTELTLERDATGAVVANVDGETNLPGLYSAGDLVAGRFKQLIIACSDGVRAMQSIYHYLHDLPK